MFSNVSTGYNNQISCFLDAVDLKTMHMLADVLPENCFASKDIMLKLLNLSSEAIVEYLRYKILEEENFGRTVHTKNW